jgi:hypothetical protein
MSVALIFPSYMHKIFTENLSTDDDEKLCVAPPIMQIFNFIREVVYDALEEDS